MGYLLLAATDLWKVGNLINTGSWWITSVQVTTWKQKELGRTRSSFAHLALPTGSLRTARSKSKIHKATHRSIALNLPLSQRSSWGLHIVRDRLDYACRLVLGLLGSSELVWNPLVQSYSLYQSMSTDCSTETCLWHESWLPHIVVAGWAAVSLRRANRVWQTEGPTAAWTISGPASASLACRWSESFASGITSCPLCNCPSAHLLKLS